MDLRALYEQALSEGRHGRFAEAARLLEQLLAHQPDHAGALNLQGHALNMVGRKPEALAIYARLLALQPDAVEALYNRAAILSDLGRPDDALPLLDRAVQLQPKAAMVLYSRGVVNSQLARPAAALADYDQALALDPGLTPARPNRAMAAAEICAWDRRDATRAELETLVREGVPVAPLTLLAYGADQATQLQAGRNMTRAFAVAPKPARHTHDRIRVAYVSSDFREHPVAAQVAPLVERHDRTRFEIIGISTGADDGGPLRARLKMTFDRFEDFADLAADEVAARMRAMEIDIAVDLNGHTSGARTAIFAARPAPVQAAWLGYPGAMGAAFCDFTIGDAAVTPPADQPFFTERLALLPDTYFPADPYRVIGTMPSRAALDLPEKGFVFCCFNNAWKITPPVFEAWMRLLAAVPGSVLWLRHGNEAATENLRRAAQARGGEASRLIFAGHVESDADHLARYARADLFLDTLPYNAHATACDALWAGLPVVTCRGGSFAGRVGASLLGAIGLPELITENLDDYERLALALAREPARLAALKDKLAKNRLTAPLFDADCFARNLEALYQRSLGE